MNVRAIVYFFCAVIFLFVSIPPSFGQTGQTSSYHNPDSGVLQTITLKDGTVLKGTLSSVTADHYVIKTPHMGEVRIPVTALLSITADAGLVPGSAAGGQGAGLTASPGSLQVLQQQLMGDPQFMTTVQTLMNDPALRELLSDPTILQDAMSMDPQRIQNNPKIQQLLSDPKMKALIDQAAGSLKMPAP